MYDFSNSFITNFGVAEGSNSWTTKCLSITDDATLGTIALSCDCIMENVPFSKEVHDRDRQIIINTTRFYTLYSQGEWFTQKNLSAPDTIFFYDRNDPSCSTLNTFAPCHVTYDINREHVQRGYLPILIRRSEDIKRLEYLYSSPSFNWYKRTKDLEAAQIVFAPIKGGKSSISKEFREPTHKYSLACLQSEWDPDTATVSKIPINFYSCAVELPGKTVYFPLRYVNRGKDYIQPISGKIAISNGVTGTIVFAYSFVSREIMCEFSLHCHSFYSPYCATLDSYTNPVAIDPQNIYLYSFAWKPQYCIRESCGY